VKVQAQDLLLAYHLSLHPITLMIL